ncbi:protein SPEC3-like isoform X2 [Sycon ciliatum]|uniref:protein SPEC3-like isoform X2 n=1 Tax=Sycon ciliatum TaxID=27933 RepID=UPI0031F67BE0
MAFNMDEPPPYDAMYPEKQPLQDSSLAAINQQQFHQGPSPQQQFHGQGPPPQQQFQNQGPPPQEQFHGHQGPPPQQQFQNQGPPPQQQQPYPMSAQAYPVAMPVASVGGQAYPGPAATTTATTVVITGQQHRHQRQRGQNPNIPLTCWGTFEYVPALPMPLAILVLIINIATCGIGTILGGLFLACIGNPYRVHQTKGEVFGWCFLLGCGQVLTALFFFMGWFWGITWGVIFITCSGRFYKRPFDASQTTLVAGAIPSAPVHVR